ncbi:hypothetical protein SAMN04487898_102322 [Pedobacter sp. ok626]|uniref:hypothetical protein n=1 Tax=Pedobacter sp. ok626 TaxID=1761882 RepID=UPI0008874F7A|nr:hypothetical protein [Pedobacter sp. ok626]SDJ34692.1 hypothetical protein SAMN04487898_102322 [Pedobacter sp. ok626]
MKNLFLTLSILITALMLSCSKSNKGNDTDPEDPAGAPSKTWQEHWGHHDLLMKRVYYDDHVAVYYDDNVDRSVTWLFKAMSDSWAYVKQTYGDFGPDKRLFANFHISRKVFNPATQMEEDQLGGGHPASYFDADHDFRNVIDNGLGNWTYPTGEQIGIPIHEMGHIVCGASHGAKGSPSDVLWGDSKFMEIFNYDVLLHIGREDEAARAYIQCMATKDDFPTPGSQWFKNWFFPIYSKYGKAAVLNRYFELLSKHFPKNGNTYIRNLNYGEFVHFWSGAAGVNLKEQATIAFGWPEGWESMFKKAQQDFPNLTYPR